MTDYSPGLQPVRREPIFNMPGVVVGLIALLVAIHAFREYGVAIEADGEILRRFGFVPARLTASFDMNAIAKALNALARDRAQLASARYFLGDGSFPAWSFVSYAFLHGDFVHVGVNCLWLAAFGGPVAMRFGVVRFMALFFVAAALGALTHYAFHRVDFVPVVGASASVSGIMAAAIRFVFQPGAPLGPPYGNYILPPDLAARLPALPLSKAFADRRVMQFTLLWFAINFIFGVAAVPLGITSSAVAWEAHAGGFIAGFLLFGLFDPPPPDASIYEDWLSRNYRNRESGGL